LVSIPIPYGWTPDILHESVTLRGYVSHIYFMCSWCEPYMYKMKSDGYHPPEG